MHIRSAAFIILVAAGCRADRPAEPREQIPRWTVTREARAGVGDGPGALTSVAGLTVGRDGAVYVTQPQEGVVRSYDRGGRFARVIGRSGAGPGEFDSPTRIGWRGDTLWVQDPGNQRISFFRADGTYLRSVTFIRAAELTDGRPQIPGYVLADGSVLGYWQVPLSELVGPKPLSVPLVRFTADGEPASLLGRMERRNQFAEMRNGSSITFSPQPFSDSQMMDVAPDGSAVVIVTRDAAESGDGATFSVRAIDPTGRVTLARRYGYVPIRLQDDVIDSTLAENAGGLEATRIKTPAAAVLRREMRKTMFVPRHLTPITSLVLGRDGTIWLRREQTGDAAVWWHVLDPAGNIIANLRLPADLSVYYADHTRLWAVERDELDVPTLASYRVGVAR
ncbi:MAG TPA: hypothetical protein VF625_10385 [Longimicrobium sp.]|jgi:hypothetical protein